MTNEISQAPAELTNSLASHKLEVRDIFMPDPVIESPPAPPPSDNPPERPSRIRFKEMMRKVRETGKLPPSTRMEGGAPASVPGATNVKERVKAKAQGIDPAKYTDKQLRSIAETLQRGDPAFLTSASLEDFGEIVVARAAADPDVSPEEVADLRNFLRELIQDVNVAEGKVARGENPQEARVRDVQKVIAKAGQRIVDLEAKPVLSASEQIELDNLQQLIPGLEQEQSNRMIDLVTSLDLQGGNLDRSTIALIVEDDRALDYLINRLLAIPLDNEMGAYNLGFWGQNNLEAVKTYLKTASDSGEPNSGHIYERYRTLLITSEAISRFHSMNALIIQGNLEGFIRTAEALSPDQLQVMQGVLGSGMVMRLLDQEYELLLSRDGWINNDNYGKMMGFVIEPHEDPKTGKITGNIVKNYEGSVFTKFKSEVQATKTRRDRLVMQIEEAKARGESVTVLERKLSEVNDSPLVDMADWEVDWAYNVGKILHNLSLRPAEYISQGKNPPGMEQYASFPQENMARLMNWVNEMLIRFDVADVRGGVHMSKDIQRLYGEERHHSGYHTPNIEKIFGRPVDFFELPGVFEVSGPMSSWRQILMVLRQIPYDESIRGTLNIEKVIAPEDEPLTIGHLLDTSLIEFSGGRKFGDLNDSEKANYITTIFLDSHGKLRPEINTSLGILLKNGSIGASGEGTPLHEAAKRKVRIALWEKIAQENPLGILPYLNGLEYKDKHKVKILGHDGKAEKEFRVNIDEFYEKLFRANEIRLERIRKLKTYANPNGDSGITLQGIIDELKDDLGWVEKDQDLLNFIIKEGVDAAPDLAEVRFNFNAFMNDVLFEDIRYGEAGAEFYRRRVAGDFGSFHKAETALISLIGNPNIEAEEMIKLAYDITEGIGGPHGTGLGQKKAKIVIDAYFHHTAVGGNDFDKVLGLDLKKHKTIGSMVNSRALKAVRIWAPTAWAMQKLNKPNSWAQQYSGSTHAPAYDVTQREEITHKAAEKGVINHHLAMALRDKWSGKFRLKFLLYLFFNLAPLMLVGGGIDITKKSMSADEFK